MIKNNELINSTPHFGGKYKNPFHVKGQFQITVIIKSGILSNFAINILVEALTGYSVSSTPTLLYDKEVDWTGAFVKISIF